MKLNGELLNAPSSFSSLPRRGRGKGEGAIEKGSGFTFLLRKALSEEACVLMVLGLLLLAGCRQKMADQPRYEPLARSTFFDDDRAARPLVEGTVARGQLRSDEHLYTGKEGGKAGRYVSLSGDPRACWRGDRSATTFFVRPAMIELARGRE